MPVMVDTSLKAKQADLRKGLPETKSFMGGKAHFGMRVDEDVYEAAREENLDMMNGGNIWDEPEFRNDMARRHPELLSPLRKKTFVVNPSERQRVASRNRFGKVSTRTWFDGDYKICEGDGLRRYTNRLTGEWRVYDLGSGEMIEEGDGERGTGDGGAPAARETGDGGRGTGDALRKAQGLRGDGEQGAGESLISNSEFLTPGTGGADE